MKKIFYSLAFGALVMSFYFSFQSNLISQDIIIDSKLNFKEAITNTKAPKEVIDSICLIDVRYYSFDGKLHQGQLVVHKELKEDVLAIFKLIEEIKFPIKKVIPIVEYKWSDDDSMEDNNTSAFNFRFVAGTNRMSNHALGRAVDINPFQNPVVYADGRISPSNAKYDTTKPGTFFNEHIIVKEFIKRGWSWGGNYKSFKDNHHFDKK